MSKIQMPGKLLSSFFLLSFLILFLNCSLSAQQKKIKKIIDTNLYELEDGSLVSLAGIEMPVKDIPGERMQDLVKDILNYADLQFRDTKVEIVPSSKSRKDSSITLVYIIKHFPFSSADLNRQCLELGFGRYIDNTEEKYKNEYRKAEEDAIKKGRGLWYFRLPEVKDTLDRKYSLSEIDYYQKQDYVNYIRFLRKKGPSMPVEIMGETLLGAIGGILGVLPGGLVASVITKSENPDPMILIGGIALGYTLGVNLGVYTAAKTTNPELSFSYTFGISSLFMFAGVGLAYTDFRNNYGTPYEWIILPLLPLISSITYVNAIAPNPVRDGLYSTQEPASGFRTIAYKDIYNNSIQFRMNLLSIPL